MSLIFLFDAVKSIATNKFNYSPPYKKSINDNFWFNTNYVTCNVPTTLFLFYLF